MGRPRDLAHDEREGGALPGMPALDIAHRDRPADRGPKAAARHPADRVAGGIEDRRALARRRAPVRAQPDAAPPRPRRERAQYPFSAGEATLGAAPLADRPGKTGLDRIGRLVDVVAVEAEAGFEAQRVARAEPRRHDLRFGEEPLGERSRVLVFE